MTPVSTRRPRATLLIVLALTGAMLVLGTGVGHAFQISQPAVVSADPVNFTPNITNGKVEAIVQVGNRMIVAGTFTQAQNAGSTTTLTRNRILAFNATTGVIDTAFNPNVNGEITSMVVAPGGTAVIIAGSFTSVGGVAATRIAKLDAVTGARITAFTATAAGTVNDMALWGSKVILGGSFNKVDNVARTKLASVDAVTGALDPNVNLSVTGLFNGGSTNVQKLDVSPDNTKLVIVGNFTTVGWSVSRADRLDQPLGRSCHRGELADERLLGHVRRRFQHLHAGRRVLSRRRVLRPCGNRRRLLPHNALRYRDAMGDERHRHGPSSDVDRLLGR